VGGLASLWAPQNVVGAQPGTAAAYEAASTRPGPGGFILIATAATTASSWSTRRPHRLSLPDRGRPRGGQAPLLQRRHLRGAGGRALIANEEDNHAIVQVGIADHSLQLLFGHPGVSDPTARI